MLITRYAKIVMAACLAAFFLLVAFDNITAWDANYPYVQHVMSMDTTFPDNALLYRSVTSSALQQLAYLIIIVSQGAAGILFLAGAFRLWQVRTAPAPAFNSAKTNVIAACLLGFVIFFFYFLVIGGEWFAMWQSKDWNAQASAFRFLMPVLAVLIFVNQHDGDVPAAATPRRAAPKRRRSAKKAP